MEVTTSEIRTFMTCVQKWDFNYNKLRILPRKEKAPTIGNAVHAGLDCFWQGEKVGVAIKAVNAEFRDFEHAKKDVYISKSRAMVIGYYAKNAYLLNEYEVLWIEEKLDPTEIAPGVFITGKVDKLLRQKNTKELHGWDHKTTSDDISIPDCDYLKKLHFDIQSIIYKWVMEKMMGEPVNMSFDVIGKEASLGPKMKKGCTRRKDESDEDLAKRKEENRETMAEYQERICKIYMDGPDKYYRLMPVHHSDAWVLEKMEHVRVATEMMQRYLDMNVFPANDNACRLYNSLCPYFEVCCGLTDITSDNYADKPNKHMELDSDENQNDGGIVPF